MSHESPPRSRPFRLDAPLPRGVTLLEASAGTGKTFTIAALVVRYVVEGIPIDRVLVVTFTRLATGELRERVRERLVSALDGLDAVLVGQPVDADDEVLQVIAGGTDADRRMRRDRLGRAVAGFDAATIETTHGFCMHVLTGLGTAGDVEPDIRPIDDARDLLDEVVDDLYVRKFWNRPGDLPFDRSSALDIGRAAIDHPAADIAPSLDAGDEETWALRRRLADAVLREIADRKRAANVLTYDDILTRLRDTLVDEARGPAACRRLRERYDVALIDEFQDTDPVQWEIVRRAFGSGESTLVLIGDPKQAIYAFRGADVFAYLEAAAAAEDTWTLDTNWRSDQGLIDADDALFGGRELGHADIAYREVHAAPAHRQPRLRNAPDERPLRFRVVPRAAVTQTGTGAVAAGAGREAVAADLAADIAGLLASGAEIVHRHRDGSDAGIDPVRPGHLAVLVRTNRQAAIACEALDAAGIPSVMAGAGSVFGTRPAAEWLRLLDALEQPAARDRAAAAALTAFVGWSAEHVATAGDDDWEALHGRLQRWAGVLRTSGVAALLEAMSASLDLPARLLRRASGERFLTDVRHVGQLLHGAATTEGLGAAALTAWLRRRIADAERDADNEERTRRLESDAEAVQVLTVHRSKGLEFPVVYCPFLWDWWTKDVTIPMFHDPAMGRLVVDVGGADAPGFRTHCDLHRTESRGEDLRLLYVALTRARHQTVVWWAGSRDARFSPLGRLAFGRASGGDAAAVPASLPKTPPDKEAFRALEELAGRAAGAISVEWAEPGRRAAFSAEAPRGQELSVRVFGRVLDDRWRRTSYSALTAAGHAALVASEPEDDMLTDERDPGVLPDAPARPDEEVLRGVSLPLAGMPGGVHVGTAVHAILEAVDFAGDLDVQLPGAVVEEASRRNVDLGDPDTVATGLAAAIRTPLGSLVGDVPLAAIGRSDRVDELAFELPLAGGDQPTGEVPVTAVAAALREWLPAGDRVAGYADRLDELAMQRSVRGYLTGSLDLVFRVDGDRYVVVDYKTNWLGTGDRPVTAWDYRPEALDVSMQRAHYPLQALLYTVALHRYLRWRLPGYDAERNLAGVLYLFVRGMSSQAQPRVGGEPCGVWAWRPPTGLVESLSGLFDQGAAG